MSIFVTLAVGTVALLMMLFSDATRSSLYDIVVPLNLQFSRLPCINILTASIFSSYLIVEYVLEFVRLVDERPQDVEVLHVFGSVSFKDIADQCCIC